MTFDSVKWGFAVQRSYGWLDSFIHKFNSPDVRLYLEVEDDKPGVPVWSSVHLNSENDPQKIFDTAYAINAIFDGAMYTVIGAEYVPFWEGRIQNLDDGQFLRATLKNFELNPFWPEYVAKTPDWPNHIIAQFIYLARIDEAALELLFFLGVNGLTWISMYAILDTMKHHGWTEKEIVASGAATSQQLSLFNHTANNFAAIGPLARHGTKGWQPPANPMSLDTAKGLVMEIAKRFLVERVRLAK